jgi:hypothetical protein
MRHMGFGGEIEVHRVSARFSGVNTEYLCVPNLCALGDECSQKRNT